MKKIIRWISDITGVTNEIEKEACKRIGHSMYDYSYWFGKVPSIGNGLALYAKNLIEGHQNLYGDEHDKLRSELYKLYDENKNIHSNK